MKLSSLPNRIFIKLLLSFWLCSSLIIAIVGILPILQEHHDNAKIEPQLLKVLEQAAVYIQQRPELVEYNPNRQQFHRLKDMENKPVRFYLLNDKGEVLNTDRIARPMRRFMLLAEDAGHPISHHFRHEILFGPHEFEVQGKKYSLYGRLGEMHPKPWFFFFAENIVLTLVFAIILSGLLCGILAWHLGKPLYSLKRSVEAVARGELNHRADRYTTERKDEIGQLAIAFNAMADSIESMVCNQQRLISGVSHELRTPLTRLQLSLALARKKGQSSTEMERIGYEAEQLETMISELLELSRSKLHLHEVKHTLSVSETLGQVLDDAEFEAEQMQKQLIIDIDEQLSFPLAPRPLARAIENLLRNAIRYAKQHICIRAQMMSDHLLIEVTDDGPGIENESDLEDIFNPFYRPQTARERESGGWGLGLAIAKAAIDSHYGTIEASNVKPHGLKVSIKLPF
ncbi:ATP-binding protein [Shewanella sp. Isolate11]|uniref:ATP-binding protein n=1 Tax=Shewanella sp. Isolate11 TaxID=2908530 RepID=UPI001EFDD788|nr:ATP-binding protein [Shewanella sp. Isolate11]MCG9697875.1 ATP-binding protein [Shewanella sp. Isolate11]